MRILWDEPKRRRNVAKHGLDFADLSMDFFHSALVRRSRAGRSEAIGLHGGIHVTVVFAPLGTEALSVISMRRSSRRERRTYETETSTHH